MAFGVGFVKNSVLQLVWVPMVGYFVFTLYMVGTLVCVYFEVDWIVGLCLVVNSLRSWFLISLCLNLVGSWICVYCEFRWEFSLCLVRV